MATPRSSTPRLHRAPTGGEISAALQRSHERGQALTWEDQITHSLSADSGSDTIVQDEKPRGRKSRMPASGAWTTYFMQEVAGDRFLEAQLLLMTVATGCLDAMTFTTYRVFTSKQTGNTLWLALYAFRSPVLGDRLEQNVGVSMGVFIAGAIFFGHMGHISQQRRRVWLLLSNTFQAILIAAAVAIRYFVSRDETGPGALAILALLAFAESGQIANALNVNMPDLNTTMVTGAIIQICSDRDFFKLRNRKRDRRILFFLALLIGCFIGASIIQFSTPTIALLVVAIIKAVIIITLFINRGMVEQRTQLEDGKERISGAATPVSRILWGD